MDTIAVFWDYENVRTNTQGIKVPLAESIIEFVNKNGYPFVMKVYANWNIISNSDLIQGLYSCGFEPIEVPMEKTNSVDLKMAVDILDIAFEKSNINHFIIVTGDKDFIPVVNWLKSRRKKVTIFGRSNSVSEHLILSAHEFIPLESLNHKKVMETSENQSIEIDFENALNCLKSSLKKARNNGKSTRLASMDNLMRENKKYNYIGIKKVRHPDDEGNFKSFKDFIIFAQNLGYVQLVTAGDFYEILLPDENPEQDSSFTVDIRINREHWIKICRDLKKFKKENLNKKTHFMKLEIIERITQFSSKENFNYSKSIITGSYDKLISVELLIPINDVDNEVKFTENKELNAEYYAKKLMKIA